MDKLNLEPGNYYLINGSKKILYWDGEKWMKPIRDRNKRYGYYVCNLEKQPTNVKTVNLIIYLNI